MITSVESENKIGVFVDNENVGGEVWGTFTLICNNKIEQIIGRTHPRWGFSYIPRNYVQPICFIVRNRTIVFDNRNTLTKHDYKKLIGKL